METAKQEKEKPASEHSPEELIRIRNEADEQLMKLRGWSREEFAEFMLGDKDE